MSTSDTRNKFVSFSQPFRRNWCTFQAKKKEITANTLNPHEAPEEERESENFDPDVGIKKPKLNSSVNGEELFLSEDELLKEDVYNNLEVFEPEVSDKMVATSQCDEDSDDIDGMLKNWKNKSNARHDVLNNVPDEKEKNRALVPRRIRSNIPGPAGSMMDATERKGGSSSSNTMGTRMIERKNAFDGPVWAGLKQKFGSEYEPQASRIRTGLYTYRIPRIGLLVDGLRATLIDNYFATLKDPSGTLEATVASDVATHLEIGCAVVLKDVPIMRDFDSKCHLIVTGSQIESIIDPEVRE